jgi:hypothetical protein
MSVQILPLIPTCVAPEEKILYLSLNRARDTVERAQCVSPSVLHVH